jgi:predicted nucleotidyltransferase
VLNTLDDIRRKLQSHKEVLSRRYKITRLGIFGSHSRGDARPDSDVDIVVEFAEPIGLEFIDLARELEGLLQRKVDLVSRNGIKHRYWIVIEPEVVYV